MTYKRKIHDVVVQSSVGSEHKAMGHDVFNGQGTVH